MKRGTTTPPPPYCDGGWLVPEYDDITDIIAEVWGAILVLEKRIEDSHDRGLEVKLNYYYELSLYWEYVYLMVEKQKFYDDIF